MARRKLGREGGGETDSAVRRRDADNRIHSGALRPRGKKLPEIYSGYRPSNGTLRPFILFIRGTPFNLQTVIAPCPPPFTGTVIPRNDGRASSARLTRGDRGLGSRAEIDRAI